MATRVRDPAQLATTHSLPPVEPWFMGPRSLKDAVAHCAQRGGRVVSYDLQADHGAKVYHVTDDLLAFDRAVAAMPPPLRNAYEVLLEHQRVKAYFDLEYFVPDHPDEERRFAELLRDTKVRLRVACASILGVRDPTLLFLDGSRLVALDAERAAKLGLPPGPARKCSCHIVVHGVAFEYNTHPALRFFVDQALPPGCLAAYVPAAQAAKVPDTKVYGRFQNFRMPGSCKRGTTTPLRLIPELSDSAPHEAAFLTLVDDALPTACIASPQAPVPRPRTKTIHTQQPASTNERMTMLQRSLQALLRALGDDSTDVQGVAEVTDEAIRFQCNHYGRGRPCLLGSTRHANNNCLLFAKPTTCATAVTLNDVYRIKYNCPSPSCATSGILAHLTWSPERADFACELYFPPRLVRELASGVPRTAALPGSIFAKNARVPSIVVATAAVPVGANDDPMDEDVNPPETSAEEEDNEPTTTTTPETYDHINPDPNDETDNYYPVVKARFERFVFQVDNPVGYAFLGYGAHDRHIQILKRVELANHFESAFFYDPEDGGQGELADRKKPFVPVWLKDPRKKKKLQIVYYPGPVPQHVFNSWDGFYADRLDPIPDGAQVDALVAPIVQHIRQCIANGKDEDTLFVLRWLAQIVRHPNEKTQVAIFLYGPEGCGKNLVFDLMQAVLGRPNGFQTSSPERDIFGTFVTAFDKALLIQTDEVKRCHDYENLFKDYVTGETVRSEHKGKDAKTVVNRANFVFTSNTEGVFRISPYDRRCVLFHCSSCFVGNEAYFRFLQPYRREPRVIRAFYQYLRDRVDLPERFQFQFNRPKTDFYREQQRLCIKPLDQVCARACAMRALRVGYAGD